MIDRRMAPFQTDGWPRFSGVADRWMAPEFEYD